MAGSIDVVLFDLDDTLCAYRRSPGEVLSASFSRAGIEPFFSVTDYYARYDEYLEESSGIDDLRRQCFGDLAAESGYDRDLGVAVAAAYSRERDQRAVAVLDGAREALDALDRDHRLGLVTNGDPAMQREKLAAVDLADPFETFVFAGFDAPPKPAPDPFERALEELAATPERAVHVGNSLATDVAGARAAGVDAAWIPDGADVPATPDPEPTYVLDSLADLTAPPWE